MSADRPELVPGLAGVPAAESAISYIDGQEGILEYRGYRIEELAQQSSFEEVAWLLMHGELPKESDLREFRADLAAQRGLPAGMVTMLGAFSKSAHPMHVLQSSIAALAAFDEPVTFGSEEDFHRAWIRLLAATPVIVATYERLRSGKQPVASDPELDTAANFLWLISGEKPARSAVNALDCALVLHGDHTMNASTFAARVVYGTNASPYDSLSAATGALHGPLHGGANERVLAALEAIGGVDQVAAWAQKRFDSKQKIMGFGHRVYKVKDPRSFALQELGKEVLAELGSTPTYDVALALEKMVVDKLGDKGIHPNVDFFSGLIYQKLGIPTDQFTPIFAIARTAGWLAHLHEQMQDNKLFRPGQIFVGERDRRYVPMDQRS